MCVCEGSALCSFATPTCPSSLLSSALGPGCHTSSCSWWLTHQSSQFAGRCFVPFCSPPPDLDTTSELSKSRDCFHTGASRPESCVCPLPLLGCLSSSPPGALCFPCQGEVLSSSFVSQNSKYKYSLQNCTGPRLAVTQKVTGHKKQTFFWPLPTLGSQTSTPITVGQGALLPQEIHLPLLYSSSRFGYHCWIGTGNDPTQEI